MPSSPDNRPGLAVWLAAAAGVLLPVVGVGLALYGVVRSGHDPKGWWFILAGVGLIVADMVLDWLWARFGARRSDEPDLNRRGAELVGQTVTVVQAIEDGGRGSVRAADTIWAAEGATADEGARVRVAAVKGTVLVVERV